MSVAAQVISTPVCTACESNMVKRNSARGPFWGCSQFPLCRGTRPATGTTDEKSAPKFDAIVKMDGSDEQEAIWACMLDGTEHIVVNAGPGTGKTYSMVQGCLRVPKSTRVRGVAFNKHIAVEMSGKLAASGCNNAQFSTCHSMGYSVLRNAFRAIGKPDTSKMKDIFERLSPEPQYGKAEWRRTLNLAAKLAGFVKNYLIDYRGASLYSEMERLADHHCLDFKSDGGGTYYRSSNAKPVADLRDAVDLLPRALDRCKEMAGSIIDYDDMVWLPIVLDLPFETCDMLIGDEQQDSNAVQHEFIMRAGKGARIVVVGDKHQAIYGFRGAHNASMEVLTEALRNTPQGVREFPLTITRRCPKLHVMMAQQLYPEIQYVEDAPLGVIETVDADKAHLAMKPGDLVLCRVNKEVISCAYKLMKSGVRPHIKGRDFGKGVLSFLESLTKRAGEMFYNGSVVSLPSMENMVKALDAYQQEELDKLIPLGDKAEGRIENLCDKCSCMSELMANAASVSELRANVTKMFGLDSDDEPRACDVVTLGTVHRTKGLEAARVFVLAPELIPHPAARKAHELIQEKNLAWVACTRAKYNNAKNEPGTLVFCGPIPPIFNEGDQNDTSRQV